MCIKFLISKQLKISINRGFTKIMTGLTEVSSNFSFGGYQKIFSHESKELGCVMKFAIYLPPAAEKHNLAVVYWLSGLTCTEKNFIEKSGFQQHAAKHSLIIVAPDTSPRGCNIPGEDDSYDFGTGAGFYVDATQEPWKKNYRMYSYVTKELPELINSNFPVLPDKQGIMGHSMGGHGAIICALKNPEKYQSVSAFAPICNPTKCGWGKKAFSGYLGTEDSKTWEEWDAVELVAKYNGPRLEILVEQGKNDEFLENQLHPQTLVDACKKKANGLRTILNMREKYDHSYYFIATFIGDHIAYHSQVLNSQRSFY